MTATPTITVLLVNPYEAPQTIEISTDLTAYQQLIGLSEDDFASLSPELIQKYSDRFKTVYLF